METVAVIPSLRPVDAAVEPLEGLCSGRVFGDDLRWDSGG